MSWFQLAAAVAAPLVGGLLNRSSSKPRQTTSTVNYEKLRDNAIKGGFNPLTALRNGGAAGHTVTTHPALSQPNPFGQAAMAGINALADWPTQQAEIRREKLEYSILEKQLKNLTRASPIAKGSFGGVPVVQTTNPAQPVKLGGGELSPKLQGGTLTYPEGWLQPRPDGKVDFMGTSLPIGKYVSIKTGEDDYGEELMELEGARRAMSEMMQNGIDRWQEGLFKKVPVHKPAKLPEKWATPDGNRDWPTWLPRFSFEWN